MSRESGTPVLLPRESLITLTHVIYALHAFSAFTGLLSSALIVTVFLTGWPSIIAVILNYAKRSEVRGTFLDSHFGWQIRTFWFALLWLLAGGVAFATLIGIVVAVAIWVITGLWVLYRIARGWMTLTERKPMPQ
ncbi:MAG: hypothetical protein WA373_08755 [Burkholderiales bacterium]